MTKARRRVESLGAPGSTLSFVAFLSFLWASASSPIKQVWMILWSFSVLKYYRYLRASSCVGENLYNCEVVRENLPRQLVAALPGSGNWTVLSRVGSRRQKGWEAGQKLGFSSERKQDRSLGWSGECRILGCIFFRKGQCPAKPGL